MRESWFLDGRVPQKHLVSPDFEAVERPFSSGVSSQHRSVSAQAKPICGSRFRTDVEELLAERGSRWITSPSRPSGLPLNGLDVMTNID